MGLLNVDIKIKIEYNQDIISQITELLKFLCKYKDVVFLSMSGVVNQNNLFDGLHPNQIVHEKISKYIYIISFLASKVLNMSLLKNTHLYKKVLTLNSKYIGDAI